MLTEDLKSGQAWGLGELSGHTLEELAATTPVAILTPYPSQAHNTG